MEDLTPVPLTPRESKAFVALTQAAIPPGEQMTAPVDPDDLTREVGMMLASMAWDGRLAVRIGVRVFDWLAVLRFGKPFTALDSGRQNRWLNLWAEGRFILFQLWARMLLTVVKPSHIARRAVQAQLGYAADRLDDVKPVNQVDLPEERVVRTLTGPTEVRCQVAIIGSGAGGAVMACELAERGIDVVLIEEGREHTAAQLGRNPGWAIRNVYREGATTLAIGRPAIPIPLGQSVGGTTTINSGTCFRVPDRVLEKWSRFGIPVDRDLLSSHFDRVEERISVQPVPEHLLGGSSHVIARGAEEMGLDHGPLRRNIKDCRQSAVCAFGCPRNAKQSMNITYVPWALEAGATLYTGLRAHKVLTRGGRATGVVAQAPGGGPPLTVHADRVISSCGTIPGVPFLAANGIRSKHLGRHMTIHPAAKIVALMPEDVEGWKDTPQGYGIYDFAREGLMFEGAFVPPEYTSIALPFVGRAFTDVMEQYKRMAVFGFMVSDAPSGRVYRGLDGRPFLTYWMTKADLELVRRGLRILSEIFFTAGAERIYLPMAGMERQDSLDEAMRALGRPVNPLGLEMAAFHPLGTARMSAKRSKGVVNPELETWEIPGLHVVDGSIFPSSLGVNPQLTIMAHASVAAERMAAQLGAH